MIANNITVVECTNLVDNDSMGYPHGSIAFNVTLQALYGCEDEDYEWPLTTMSPRRRPVRLQMSWFLQIAWSLLFAFMLVVAIGGNIIVIWIVIAHRRMRTVTNYFLLNLSIADLMMSVFNCIFNFVYMLNKFLAINRPLKPRMSKTIAQMTIIAIWLTSLTLGSPCLLYSTTITYKYNLILFLVTYIVPMTAMVCCYTAMGRELWGSRSIGELTQRQTESIKSKRKVVRMFIVIVTIFGVCWLPYHCYFLYAHYHRDIGYSKYVQHIYLTFYWLAMSNAMVNPLIYYWMNARFRQYFRTAVCEWPCLRRQEVQSDIADTPPMIRRCSHSYSRSRSGTGDDCSLNDKTKQQRLTTKPENKQCFCPMGTHLRHQCRHQPVHKGVAVTWRHQPVMYTQVHNRAAMSSQV